MGQLGCNLGSPNVEGGGPDRLVRVDMQARAIEHKAHSAVTLAKGGDLPN